jgi:beta-mannosidase
MAMVAQVAWYRHGAGQTENNLGALVWQLNDIWQGVSWSSIEYSGRWKVLQYGLTGAFSPVIIYPFWTAKNESLEVLVISDRWESVTGFAQLTWYDWNGTLLDSEMHAFEVGSLNNSLIVEKKGLKNILPTGKKATEVWMLLNVTAEVEGRIVTNEQWVRVCTSYHYFPANPTFSSLRRRWQMRTSWTRRYHSRLTQMASHSHSRRREVLLPGHGWTIHSEL